jgi:hypothetical protein
MHRNISFGALSRRFSLLSIGCAAALVSGSHASAQLPPPNPIFDLSTSSQLHAPVLSTYQQFTTSFVGDGNTEYVSFAFREQPAYFSFDDAVVSAAGSSTNLLVNPGFEQGATTGPVDVGLNYPDNWGRWIQSVDTSAIGQVDATGYGCSANAHTGLQFWCDGSVQGYDGIYQAIATTAGRTYNISFWLDDNSGQAVNNPAIDMLVYAGDQIPVGSTSIAPPPPPTGGGGSATPEPASLALIGGGLATFGLLFGRRKRNA